MVLMSKISVAIEKVVVQRLKILQLVKSFVIVVNFFRQ